jgi:hypothetical protein
MLVKAFRGMSRARGEDFIKKIMFVWQNVSFLVRNLWAVRKISVISSVERNGMLYRGMARGDWPEIDRFYRKLHSGARLDLSRRILYAIAGSRMVLVAESTGTMSPDALMGFSIYYFNPRDIEEGTIHLGFYATQVNARGKGVATSMKLQAKHHFGQCRLYGISSRISLSNIASLRVAKKVGFRPVEKYYDPASREERYYLICPIEHTFESEEK